MKLYYKLHIYFDEINTVRISLKTDYTQIKILTYSYLVNFVISKTLLIQKKIV